MHQPCTPKASRSTAHPHSARTSGRAGPQPEGDCRMSQQANTLAPDTLAPQTSASQLGPRLHPIKVLHRHEDGIIAFALNEDDKGFRPSFGIKASALESMFPGFVDRLTTNSYVSINAAYALAYGNKGKVVGMPRHRSDTLKLSVRVLCRHRPLHSQTHISSGSATSFRLVRSWTYCPGRR